MDDRLAAARPGERWVLRHRLPDGSATDVIGWLEALDDDRVIVSPGAGRDVVSIPRADIILARRAPAAAGGAAPTRTSAADLEQIARPGWLAAHESLGDWTLRSGGGFTGRANSCLAVGDPGMAVADAAQRIVAYAADHDIPAWAQVIDASAEDQALVGLGWRPVYVETEVLAVRLADLLATSLPDPAVAVSEDVSAFWSTYAQSRPYAADPEIVRMIIDGNPPRAYGTITLDGEVIAIGRGHLNAGWLGLAAIWTRPDHRRTGRASMIMIALGHWAARRGARWAYLQVAAANSAAISAYERVGFVRHHRYRYLAAPGQSVQMTRSVGA